MNIVTRLRGPSWAHLRDELSTRRAAGAARKALESDLASFTTPTELTELAAILERHGEEEVADIRRILDRRLYSPALNSVAG
jgi:hypothetical protein